MSNETQIPTVVQRQIDIVCRMLDNLPGAHYKIILPDGTSYGALEVAEPKAPGKRTVTVKVGAYKEVYAPIIDALQPGQVAQITVPEDFDFNNFCAAAGSYAGRQWGSETYTSARKPETRVFEILRY